MPSTSGGRPRILAAAPTSPSCRSSRMRVDEAPSTGGTRTTEKPCSSRNARSPRRRWPKRKSSPATTISAPIRAQNALGELLGLLLLELVRELEHERLLDPGLLEELQAPLERREQLDAVAEHEARMRIERDRGGDEPACRQRLGAPPGGPDGRRRRRRSRPLADAGRAPPPRRATFTAAPSRRPPRARLRTSRAPAARFAGGPCGSHRPPRARDRWQAGTATPRPA